MKKTLCWVTIFALFPLLSACGTVGEKSMGASAIYAAMALFSLVLLLCYLQFVRKKTLWLTLLLGSVLVVNGGYYALSISQTLSQALLANRVSYLGSVFLPLSMLMLLLRRTGHRYPKWLPAVLSGVGVLVFLVAASPGYLDLYYKGVSLRVINGATVLEKVYGSWHKLYLFYLLSYFAATVGVVSTAIVKKRTESGLQSAILAAAVFVNIGVWFLEQLVRVDFELLSVSYNVSIMFLLCLHLFVQQTEKRLRAVQTTTETPPQAPKAEFSPEQLSLYRAGVQELTQTERKIYDYYMEHKSSQEILIFLNIKENTLKYHNKNIYSKLGVNSRKQLVAMGKAEP